MAYGFRLKNKSPRCKTWAVIEVTLYEMTVLVMIILAREEKFKPFLQGANGKTRLYGLVKMKKIVKKNLILGLHLMDLMVKSGDE